MPTWCNRTNCKVPVPHLHNAPDPRDAEIARLKEEVERARREGRSERAIREALDGYACPECKCGSILEHEPGADCDIARALETSDTWSEIETLQIERDALEAERDALTARVEALVYEQRACHADKDALTARLAEVERQRNEAQAATGVGTIHQLQAALAEAEQARDEAESARDEAQAEYRIEAGIVNELAQANTALRKDLATAHASVEKMEQERNEARRGEEIRVSTIGLLNTDLSHQRTMCSKWYNHAQEWAKERDAARASDARIRGALNGLHEAVVTHTRWQQVAPLKAAIEEGVAARLTPAAPVSDETLAATATASRYRAALWTLRDCLKSESETTIRDGIAMADDALTTDAAPTLEAIRTRLEAGHSASCMDGVGKAEGGTYACDCGHDALAHLFGRTV